MSTLIECPEVDERFELLPGLRYTALVEVDYVQARAMQANSAEEIITLTTGSLISSDFSPESVSPDVW